MASAAVVKLVKRSGHEGEEIDWVKIAAGGSLVAAGLLVITGNRKSGVAAAAAGTALALLDQQPVIRKWWNQLPGYVDQLQGFLSKVQEAVDDVASKREKLREVLQPK
ncbi:MAG: hypothetical protein KGN79_12050 [Acidobacteriota bacterium]|nr:hypothetical protein [Acidobacteriota bacterium]